MKEHNVMSVISACVVLHNNTCEQEGRIALQEKMDWATNDSTPLHSTMHDLDGKQRTAGQAMHDALVDYFLPGSMADCC